MKVVVPKTTDELLINPGKGWVVFSGMNPGAFGTFPEAAIAYLRVNWADLEPREGDYRWDLWEPAMRFWTGTGKRIALGVMCANAHSKGKWCTPQWVADAGAKGYDYRREGDEYNVGAPITRWEPDYADPVFLEKLEQFVAAFAARYDGNPQIEFIDIRSYGIWGEWHTSHPVATDVLERHIDLHVRHFRRTQLVVQWGMDANIPVYRHAFERGVGFRRDGVGGPPIGREAEMYPLVWGRAPVVFEFWGHYEWLKQKGWWMDHPIEPYMEKQHAAYISLYHEKNARTFIDQEPVYIRRLGNRMGYYFVLTRAEYPGTVVPGGVLELTLQWENRGVAVCLANYPLAVFLTDSQGRVVSTTVSAECDTRRWEPGKTATERIRVQVPPCLPPGCYTVSIGLLESPLSNRCAVRLGIAGRDAEGRYPLGEVVLGKGVVQLLPDIGEAYKQAADRNVLRALNPKIFFGYFSVCADGQGHGGNTTYPGLDWGQSAEALLWLGRRPEVLASWEYVKGFQREDGLLPFAILPDMAGKTSLVDGRYPLKVSDNGAVFEHWVPGNPLRTLANVTFLMLADSIFDQTADTAWLKMQGPWLRRAAVWLMNQITVDGLMPGGGFYVERPTRLEFDGVNQCYSAHALSKAAGLFTVVDDPATATFCRNAASTLTTAFRRNFWAGDHCVEYIHPERGSISHHGMTDVDWAAVATGIASEDQIAVLWPQLKDNAGFVYSGMPGGLATNPESYEDWEMQNIDRHDLAAMGRCWYLECWARSRMGDQEGILRSLRQVAAIGEASDWSWKERYYSERTGDLGKYHMNYYCEYPATLIRIIHRFL